MHGQRRVGVDTGHMRVSGYRLWSCSMWRTEYLSMCH